MCVTTVFPTYVANYSNIRIFLSMKQIREDVKKEDTVVKSKTTHHSQTDAAKGFGGKYGVQKERQDKVPQSNIFCVVVVRFL